MISLPCMLISITQTLDDGAIVDHRIWYATLENKIISFDTSSIHPSTCEPLLEESLRKSVVGSTTFPDPFTIPGQDWAFQTAYQNGEFIQFYKGLLAEGPIDFISEWN